MLLGKNNDGKCVHAITTTNKEYFQCNEEAKYNFSTPEKVRYGGPSAVNPYKPHRNK